MRYFKLSGLLQQEIWIRPAFVGVDEKGLIQYLSDQAPSSSTALEIVDGLALPGFQNVHSHAFQYAMAGIAENHPREIIDDFWTWREAMYQCALSLDPEQVQAIATANYAEMLRHGYTHVAEFHYLHHDQKGQPYLNIAEMGERIIRAAQVAGIKLTLIPIFYQKGGFGLPATSRQKRFISRSIDDYFALLFASQKIIKNQSDTKLGFGVHSLRAVDLDDVVKTFENGPLDLPFHMHIAEQKKEVSDCLNYCQRRPVQWLLENLDVNDRFNLVHATHLNEEELASLAASEANVVLCPSTEGNLGDGIFPMMEYVARKGRWSIGSDSQINLNPLEEFRMIDYRQRLRSNRRNALRGDVAQYLVNEAYLSGQKALARNSANHFEVAKPFDAIIYDANSYLLGESSTKNLLATLIYTSDVSKPLGTIINGEWVVKEQRHRNDVEIKAMFRKAMGQLRNR